MRQKTQTETVKIVLNLGSITLQAAIHTWEIAGGGLRGKSMEKGKKRTLKMHGNKRNILRWTTKSKKGRASGNDAEEVKASSYENRELKSGKLKCSYLLRVDVTKSILVLPI